MSLITFQSLRDRDVNWLSDAATGWRTYSDSLEDIHDDVRTEVGGAITRSSWQGDAADQAVNVCDELVSILEVRKTRASGIAEVISRCYDSVSGAQTTLRSAVRNAEASGCTVSDSGTVSAVDPDDEEAVEAVSIYQTQIDNALSAAQDADNDTLYAINDLVPAQPGFNTENEFSDMGDDLRSRLGVSPPPTGGSAADNADWWESLSEDEQNAYKYGYPDRIGMMDGLPTDDRHDANMMTLRNDVENGHDAQNAQNLLDRVEESQYKDEAERIFLLGYVPPGADGDPDALVIAAIGNPDTADNVGVFVPGTGTDLSNVEGNIDRMDDLRNEANMVPGSGTTSTIVWLGYDAPDTIPHAILPGYATDGAPDLRDFTRGLAASHEGDPAHTTVIGHSYGSTVVGTADALGGQGTDDGLVTDDIIAVGSPGMGVESPDRRGFLDGPLIDDVSDMHIDENHFWAAAGADDIVSYTEVHGNSPVDWSFGGQRISTDGASGHSEYWNPDTDALRNQAYILTGEYDQVETIRRRFG